MFLTKLKRSVSVFLILCLVLSGGFVYASEDPDPAARIEKNIDTFLKSL